MLVDVSRWGAHAAGSIYDGRKETLSFKVSWFGKYLHVKHKISCQEFDWTAFVKAAGGWAGGLAGEWAIILNALAPFLAAFKRQSRQLSEAPGHGLQHSGGTMLRYWREIQLEVFIVP